MTGPIVVPYYDEQIAAHRELQEARELRRQYNRAVKIHGGSWKCHGGCGRRISANKYVCMDCGLKGVAAKNAVDLAEQPA